MYAISQGCVHKMNLQLAADLESARSPHNPAVAAAGLDVDLRGLASAAVLGRGVSD